MRIHKNFVTFNALSSPDLRKIPSVDRVLAALSEHSKGLPRPIKAAFVRRELARLREQTNTEVPAFEELVEQLRITLNVYAQSRIRPVINGTGILIHTNLGRASLGPQVVADLEAIARSYSNLEFDLSNGERGSRGIYVEQCLASLAGAEAATVVNNCAAALVLMLTHLTRQPGRKQVIISRGELIQIGGGFRIPDILAATGAELIEIGTTNQTTLSDYRNAIGESSALILKVHRSNFYMGGFVSNPAPSDIANLARNSGLLFVEDLGSGALISTETLLSSGKIGDRERTPAEALKEGVDLVCFSGDKLLGGPQAGIIVGRARNIRSLKRDPLFRALRCDKLILTALQRTAEIYLNEEFNAIPVLRLLKVSLVELRARANRISETLRELPATISVCDSAAQVGGGTMPATSIESIALSIVPDTAPVAELAQMLRNAEMPVIGYIGKDSLRLDLRTIFPEQDIVLSSTLSRALVQIGSQPASPTMTQSALSPSVRP